MLWVFPRPYPAVMSGKREECKINYKKNWKRKYCIFTISIISCIWWSWMLSRWSQRLKNVLAYVIDFTNLSDNQNWIRFRMKGSWNGFWNTIGLVICQVAVLNNHSKLDILCHVKTSIVDASTNAEVIGLLKRIEDKNFIFITCLVKDILMVLQPADCQHQRVWFCN